MRLGGPVFGKPQSAEQWVEACRAMGWRAAVWPLPLDAGDALVDAYVAAARAADIHIAEVGAWSNPISPDPATRQAALDKCIAALRVADRVGARCAVTIAGSRGDQWNGPHPDNLTHATFELVTETVRSIIDAAQPQNACFTLEMMGWCIPDSPHVYSNLLRAIGRETFAVHYDPVNLINSPDRFFHNADLIQRTVETLGPWIKSVHLKDVTLAPRHLVHLDECRPGTGQLDYPCLLRALQNLADPDLPLILEHLPSQEQYQLAADFVRQTAQPLEIPL